MKYPLGSLALAALLAFSMVALAGPEAGDMSDWRVSRAEFEAGAAVVTAQPHSDDTTSYFVAPDRLLGDWSAATAIRLEKRSSGGRYFAGGYDDIGDIVLKGPGGVASYRLARDHSGKWREFRLPLYGAGWSLSDGAQDLSDVLDDVTAFHIRAEYGVGRDRAALRGVEIVSVAPSPVAAEEPAAQTGEEAAPDTSADEVAEARILFDGESLEGWESFGFSAGSFDGHARLAEGVLRFDIPDGKGWAKTGLRSADPVITMPARGTEKARAVTLRLDATASNTVTLAFTPPEAAEEDPYRTSDLRLQLRREGDGLGKLQATKHGGRLVEVEFPWPAGATPLNVILRPDQVVELRDGDGNQLAWLPIETEYDGREWVLQVYAQVPGKNDAARLALEEVGLRDWPHETGPDYSVITGGPRRARLFDGRTLAPRWTPTWNTGAFRDVARLEDGALRVDWPEGRKRIKMAGIYSPDPVLWLDRFREDAQARITLHLDGAASRDFALALQQRYNLVGNWPGGGNYAMTWRRQADGSYSLISGARSYRDRSVELTGFEAIPDEVALVLTPEGVVVEAEGRRTAPAPLAEAQGGAGLRLWIYALRPETGDAALVLRGIDLDQRQGPEPRPVWTASGVEPLPQETLFAGRLSEDWTAESNGDARFEDLAQEDASGLTLARNAPKPHRQRIALKSAAPVVDLDERIAETPFDLRFQFDPTVADFAGRILLADRAKDITGSPDYAITLRRLTSGPNAGRFELALLADHFSYGKWRRLLPPGWEAVWDGTLRVTLDDGRIDLRLDRDIGISALTGRSKNGSSYYLGLVPGGPERQDGGRITLKEITAGWRTPDGLTAPWRWRLLDDDAFDAEAFLQDLADSLETGEE